MTNSLSDFGVHTMNPTGIETCVKHIFKQSLTDVPFV